MSTINEDLKIIEKLRKNNLNAKILQIFRVSSALLK